MTEELVRQELPIQSIYQRDHACTATVPIHLDILNLPEETRTDPSLISDAKNVVGAWYDEDMNYYLDILKREGIELPHLQGYEQFKEEWQFGGKPDENGFLSLVWEENGEVHRIGYVSIPVVLHNRHNEFGEFYTPEFCKKRGWIEIMYRNLEDPEFVSMGPEKLKKYGLETDITKMDIERGIAEVVGSAFCSDYHHNMAKALLLRDFAVFYLNKLLSTTK